MINQVLHTLLSADADYSEKMSDPVNGGIKLFPKRAPQGTARPYARTRTVSRVEDQNKQARGIYTVNIDITHYASSHDEATELENLCIKILNRYKGVVDGMNIKSIRVEGGGDGFDNDTESDTRSSEFSIKINP